MKCAIMQPTYLPWAGYFNLFSQVDIFVFLDDAQFQKNSWHNRNRVLLNHSPHWMTVPVRQITLNQAIHETKIDSTKTWRKKHIKLLQQTYAKHPFINDVLDICGAVEKENTDNLAKLNIVLIQFIMKKIGINTDIMLSSEMNIEGSRTERIIAILQKLKVNSYLSPKGASEYLEDDGFIEKTPINLKIQEFDPAPYSQYKHDSFESHLSIVDVVANLGWDGAKEYINYKNTCLK
jgi:hypothetical protein